MTERPSEGVEAVLARLGIAVPAEDLPFLQRTLARQRELLAAWAGAVPPDTEPALVFRVPPPETTPLRD